MDQAIVANQNAYETEVVRHSDRFGNIIQAFSTYVAKNNPEEVSQFHDHTIKDDFGAVSNEATVDVIVNNALPVANNDIVAAP